MKTITSLITILLFTCFTLTAQKTIKGDGNQVTKTRSVGDFDKIAVSGHFKVTLEKGKEGDITIKGEGNIIEKLETTVNDGVLKIKFKKGLNFRSHKTIYLTIGYQDIEGVSLSGSGEVVCNDLINAKDLNLSLSGSGNFKLNVESTNLDASISGSGNMSLTGNSNNFSTGISGSGNMNAQKLTAQVVNAKISGSGNVKVNAVNEINAKTSGSGNIIYSGNPTIIKANSSGSGSIQKRN